MPHEIEIRPIRDSEYAEAGDATARAYREFLTPDRPGFAAYVARIADIGARVDHAAVLVAVVDGVIAGSATLEVDSRVSPTTAEPLEPDEAHLRMLGVRPDLRGLGIGRRLVDACIEVARERGKRRLTLDTSPLMEAAQRMYSTMGFAPTGERSMPDGGVLLGYSIDVQSAAPATR
ncbi:MAG: GNAT family N-acetyltransferase [Candidatus Dormibacteria bacterium]